MDKPCEDYKLYHVHIPAQRSLGYREFLGLQREERRVVESKRKKLMMPAVLVSNPSMLASKKSKSRWKNRQKKLSKQYKKAQLVYLQSRIDEHASVPRQAKLIGILHRMVKSLSF